MKRIFAALIICSAVTTNAMADAFGTVSLDDAALQAPPKYSDEVFEVTDIKPLTTTKDNVRVQLQDRQNQYAKQNVKLQDALLKIESAQTDVKTQLGVYQSQLAEIKAREAAVKSERRSMEKNIRDVKKRNRSLESAMKKINYNMKVIDQNK